MLQGGLLVQGEAVLQGGIPQAVLSPQVAQVGALNHRHQLIQVGLLVQGGQSELCSLPLQGG